MSRRSQPATSVQRLHRDVKALLRVSALPMPRRKAELLGRDLHAAMTALAAAPSITAFELDAKLATLVWQLRRQLAEDANALPALALAFSIREDLRLFWSEFEAEPAP